jgi:hypothetical protein
MYSAFQDDRQPVVLVLGMDVVDVGRALGHPE